MGLVDGKVAVITGAGSGMGKASALLFAAEGAKVVVADVSGAQDAVAAEIGDAAVAVRCDVTKEADVEAMMRTALDRFGRLDAVLNVAGIAEGVMLTDVTQPHWDRTLDIDLRGVLHGLKHGILAMREAGNGGAIVNWSSIGGLNASMATSAYAAAKAGVVSLTKSGAVEAGGEGIRVNCVCPGYIKTEIMGASLDQYPPAAKLTPMRRLGQAHEVAEVALFLASDRASFVNGAIIPVDGGRSVVIA